MSFYHSVFSDDCLPPYILKVFPDVSSSLLKAFLVELGSLHGTLKHVLYLMQGLAGSHSVNYNRVQVLSIPELLLVCSQD